MPQGLLPELSELEARLARFASRSGSTAIATPGPERRKRIDGIDPVARLLNQSLGEVLTGATVLDWAPYPQDVVAGRAAADGLVYRFRCDAESVAFRPAWDGLSETQWEKRSEGFLAARDPSVRLDFKGVRFQQKRSKRQCQRGYGCGSSCISLEKECKITPGNSQSKQRLRQLQVLAREGDPRAQALASQVQSARTERAGSLREERQVATLRRMLQDPKIAAMVRSGGLPQAETAGATDPTAKTSTDLAGTVQVVDPGAIKVDPKRFQYKIVSNDAGEVGSLKGVRKWDDNLAGVVSVWQDPKDGETYVVNGHNRLGLAKRTGVEGVTVRYLRAQNAKEARAIGAMQNIAEGAGTEVDAAKFFRDSGIRSREDVESRGLPLTSGKASKGLALARLPKEMFDQVVQGDLSTGRGAIIGGSGLDEAKQREIGKLLRKRAGISDGTLQGYVEALAVSQRQQQESINLFGTTTEDVDSGLARAELVNAIGRKIGKERRLFGMVSTSRAAEALQEKAGNVINREQSADVASEANQLGRMFGQMKNLSGPMGEAINAAAERVMAGEKRDKVQRELYEEVVAAMKTELKRFGLEKKPSAPPASKVAPTASMFDSARLALLEGRIDGLRRRCATGYGCGSSCIAKEKECREQPTGRARQMLGRLAQLAKGAVGAAGAAARRLSTARPAGGPSASTAETGSTASAMAGAERIRAMAAERGQASANQAAALARKEEEMLRRSPRQWGVKEVMKDEEKEGDVLTWHESRYEVQLERPVRVAETRLGPKGDRLVDTLALEVMAEPTYAKPIARKLAEQGINLPGDAVSKAVELSWFTGAFAGATDQSGRIGERDAKATADRLDLPPEVARRFSTEISRRVKDVVSQMAEGQLVVCSAHREDGFGDRRQKLYERAGFTFVDGKGVAIVRNGKLSRLGAKAKDRTDSADEINLTRLIEQLLTLGADDGTQRIDALAARLDALRRKCSTGYGCGSACISLQKECRARPASAIGKERLQRLQQLAQGQVRPRGLGVPSPAAASALAADIQGRRTNRAAELTAQRGARAARNQQAGSPAGVGASPAGALVPARSATAAIEAEIVGAEVIRPGAAGGPPSTRPPRMSDMLRESLAALKAADARQMGRTAEHLFEAGWSLERNTKYKGLTKEQARDRYKAELLQAMQMGSPQAQEAVQGIRERAAAAGSVSGALRSLISDMKAQDERMADLERQAVNLRVKASDIAMGGSGANPLELTSPGRAAPQVPAAKQPGLNAQDVVTSNQQQQFAQQQRQAAAAAGDRRGAEAWRREERAVNRARVTAAVQRSQQSQSSLFGVTDFDESMPLFNRRDGMEALEGRMDALRRKCSTGYGCGSACISLQKECRARPASAIGKERLQRLGQLARGEIRPRGLGVPNPEAASALAAERWHLHLTS